ncbi:unnamed protein product, partial [Prorocentrum cordatum]
RAGLPAGAGQPAEVPRVPRRQRPQRHRDGAAAIPGGLVREGAHHGAAPRRAPRGPGGDPAVQLQPGADAHRRAQRLGPLGAAQRLLSRGRALGQPPGAHRRPRRLHRLRHRRPHPAADMGRRERPVPRVRAAGRVGHGTARRQEGQAGQQPGGIGMLL